MAQNTVVLVAKLCSNKFKRRRRRQTIFSHFSTIALCSVYIRVVCETEKINSYKSFSRGSKFSLETVKHFLPCSYILSNIFNNTDTQRQERSFLLLSVWKFSKRDLSDTETAISALRSVIFQQFQTYSNSAPQRLYINLQFS